MTARCQGNVYEMLYSPGSLEQPDHVRKPRVTALANELNDVREKAAEIKLASMAKTNNKVKVLFCQVIETQDEMDLDLLHSFIQSMESAPPVSDAPVKMLWLFQVLYNVAIRYIEFRTLVSPPGQVHANAELNAYSTALGLPLPFDSLQQLLAELKQPHGVSREDTKDSSMGESTEGQREVNQRMWSNNPAQLEEWFNSNHQMMELMEEPTFNFP
ncbi:hypothetical protein QQZ08_010031 [Neonectria magnoliae]|uniref:Uncharacterized protein n=1 Tax=Neonectria magnoliae TaxID=2732573 RepID=A0ABR1HJG6_9HYPO